MKCSQCRYDNPESVKFCGNCGSRIEKICSNCGTVNPPQFKFCGECGREVSSPSRTTSAVLTFDQMLAKIQGYLPEGLTEKILSQKERIQGEKRQVTVLFCDMENFTALSERIGPEGGRDRWSRENRRAGIIPNRRRSIFHRGIRKIVTRP